MTTNRVFGPGVGLGYGMLLILLACSSGSPTEGPTSQQPPVPLPVPAAGALLYTTLDDAAAVMAPAAGAGVGAAIASAPANDFVPARVANGFHADAIGERILLRQLDGTRKNVELERGTMEFLYQPAYNHDDNLKYTIAGTGSWGSPPSPGSLHFGKHNNSNGNDIFLIFFDAAGTRYEHNVRAASYSWRAGDWLLVRITWDFSVAPGVQNLRLYLNNTELPLTGQVARGPQQVPAEKASEMLYIGSRDTSGNIIPKGVYDEFRIYDRVLPP